jgi:hypothetical protein
VSSSAAVNNVFMFMSDSFVGCVIAVKR